MAQRSRPFLLIPLYIYPTTTSWEPLFCAATSHPQLGFLVIVNPANGPGSEALPDANYMTALAKLTTLPNVTVLGYVHCSYGHRALADVQSDVKAYQSWHIESLAEGYPVRDMHFSSFVIPLQKIAAELTQIPASEGRGHLRR
jgi:hypothetical protein